MKRNMEKPLQAVGNKNKQIKAATTAVNWDDYIKTSANANDLYRFDLQHLPAIYLTPSHFLSLQAYLNTHPEITTIKISNASNQSIVLLSAVIANNTTLIAIDLSYNEIGAEGMKHVAVALAKNTTLTSIDLESNELGVEGAKHMASALMKNIILTTINLSDNELGKEGAKHVAGALVKNTTLTSINLESNQLGAEGAKHVAGALAKNATLTSINLGYNQLGAEGAKHVATALAKNTTLASICLNGNKFDTAAAKHMAGALTKNTTLTSIDLSSNYPGTVGAKHLLEAILKNPVCTTIKLDRNYIDNRKLLIKINQQLNINKQRKTKLRTTTKILCLALRHGSLFAKKTIVIPKGLRKHLIKKMVGHAYELTPNQVSQLLLNPK